MENKKSKDSPTAIPSLSAWDEFYDFSHNEALDHTGSERENNYAEPILQEPLPFFSCPGGSSTEKNSSSIEGVRMNCDNFMAGPRQSIGFQNPEQIAQCSMSFIGETSFGPQPSISGRVINDINAIPSVFQLSNDHRSENQNNFLHFGGSASIPFSSHDPLPVFSCPGGSSTEKNRSYIDGVTMNCDNFMAGPCQAIGFQNPQQIAQCSMSSIGETSFGPQPSISGRVVNDGNVIPSVFQLSNDHRPQNQNNFLHFGGSTSLPFSSHDLRESVFSNDVRGCTLQSDSLKFDDTPLHLGFGGDTVMPPGFPPHSLHRPNEHRGEISTNGRADSTKSVNFLRPGTGRNIPNNFAPRTVNFRSNYGSLSGNNRIISTQSNVLHGPLADRSFSDYVIPSSLKYNQGLGNSFHRMADASHVSSFASRNGLNNNGAFIHGSNAGGRILGLEGDMYTRHANIYPHESFQDYLASSSGLSGTNPAQLLYNNQVWFQRMATSVTAARSPNITDSRNQQKDSSRTITGIPFRSPIVLPFIQAAGNKTGQDRLGQVHSFGDHNVAQTAENLGLPVRPVQLESGGLSQIPYQGKPGQIKGNERAKVLETATSSGRHHLGHRRGSPRWIGQTKGSKSAKVPFGPATGSSSIHHPVHTLGSLKSPDTPVPVAERSGPSLTCYVPRKSRYQRSTKQPKSNIKVSPEKPTPQPSVCFSPPSSGRTSPTHYIKWQDEEPWEPMGVSCSICERDLRNTPPDAASEPSKLPSGAVLPCQHAFHDQCLQFITPEEQSANPPCILCASKNLELPD